MNPRLMCLYCGDSQANSVVSEEDDESADEMSSMSLEVNDGDEIYLSSAAARTMPLEENDPEWDQSDGSDVMSLNSDNMQVLEPILVNPLVQADSEGTSTSTSVAFDEAAILDMVVDPTQGAIGPLQDPHFDFYEYLELDESEEDEYEANFLARSCATRRPMKANYTAHGKPETSSWVMVHVKSKLLAESPFKVSKIFHIKLDLPSCRTDISTETKGTNHQQESIT
jgi:hypothetical protein